VLHLAVVRQVSQRELRNQSGEIMRGLDRGEEFLITRNGVVVGELRPVARRRSVSRESLLRAFKGAGETDYARFRRDIDKVLDQNPEPRV
jgi:antitoxin (DNA-binding transcriptional repressor) of toxin-antitoxin stability system